ncbi:hypothetical protein [Denitrobaculum tricleocarpae]|uniref:Uncharacterized protein n=1 Tax=Denitrobaculum tricleocarpae TaxID=2591009 RepID=A0A545TU88_9PROT|nr:hypothetical protein [Denitrobaculum tricleocarpae]TQV80783.1 hypothetical protein FKG95_11580 [Denitrobaculum tricleocarpae]
MPRFPILPQRTSAPAAFSSTPRAQAAHFGAGTGRHLADLGAGAAELGQVIEQRQKRQAEQQMSQFDRDLAKRRAESDAQAPPEEDSESRINRYESLFKSSADAVLQQYEGQALHERLSEGIEARRDAYRQKLLAREAQQRLRASLDDTQALVQQWSERVAQDPAEFINASLELFGDETSGEAGLLAGLGLRPEALAAWKTHSLNQLLDARMTSDPAGLIAELETGNWHDQLSEERLKGLLDDAREVQQRRASAEALELGQQSAGTALQLSNDIGAGRAGQAEIRRAEEAGTLSASQAKALRAEVARAEIARQAQQIAGDELALTLSTGMGFDPENPQNRRAVDAFYEKVYSQALRAGAPEEVVAQVVSTVAKTGYMPPHLAKDTTGLLHSGDDERRLAGATLYGGLRDAAPLLASLAFDPETRARGGILKRWLDLGLEPPEALRRAEAEWPGDGNTQMLEPDEMLALKRDLGSLFTGEHSGPRVDQILDQLEQNYLDDLGKGMTPRQARRQLRRDAGRVIGKLTSMRVSVEGNFPDNGRSLLFVPVRGGGARPPAPGGGKKSASRPGEWYFGPFGNPLDDELANAAGLELERLTREAAAWMIEVYLSRYSLPGRLRASVASSEAETDLSGPSVSIGDGESIPSKILAEDNHVGSRTLKFEDPRYGDVTIRQYYDLATGRYYSVEAYFTDPETGQVVIETLPSSRLDLKVEGSSEAELLYRADAKRGPAGTSEDAGERGQATVVPSDEHRPMIQPGPPADPVPTLPLPPSEAGPGQELMPSHTGGNPTDHGPLPGQAPGFPAQEQEPLILASPDQSDDLSGVTILHSESSDDAKKKVPKPGADTRLTSGVSETDTTGAHTSRGSTQSSDSSTAASGSGTPVTSTETDQANADVPGIKLTRGGKRELGALASLKDTTALEAVKMRGGGAKEIQAIRTDYQQKTLAELANLAALDDEDADRAIKIVKSAKRLAQKNHGQ